MLESSLNVLLDEKESVCSFWDQSLLISGCSQCKFEKDIYYFYMLRDCQIQYPDRGKAATASWPQLEPGVKLSIYFQETHTQTHIYSAYIYVIGHTEQHKQKTHHKHKQYSWYNSVPLSE